LQKKLDRYFDGKRVIEVAVATRSGSPIATWIDVRTGEPTQAWTQILRPAMANKRSRPAIVLAQQSLQGVFGARSAGIRNAQNTERIDRGAEVLKLFAERVHEEGADEVFIAMHIYKNGMEPAIGNERLALAKFLKNKTQHVYAGPDVWTPTKELWPKAFSGDKRHPNSIGMAIMAQHWFETLLEHDGLEVPQWSRDEMAAALKSEPLPQQGGRLVGRDSTGPQTAGRGDRSGQPQRRGRTAGESRQRGQRNNAAAMFQRLARRFDKNGDGKVTRDEFNGPARLFDRFDANRDGVITADEAGASEERSAPERSRPS